MKIHKHIWLPIEKRRLPGLMIHQCLVCGKVKGFKGTKFPAGVHNYLWCPKCGFELVHQAIDVKERPGQIKGEIFYDYKCPRCKERSVFTFDRGPMAIQID